MMVMLRLRPSFQILRVMLASHSAPPHVLATSNVKIRSANTLPAFIAPHQSMNRNGMDSL